MQYLSEYGSPIGKLVLTADESALTGVWFEGQNSAAGSFEKQYEKRETPVLQKTKQWLDMYFAGIEPEIEVPMHFVGSAFQLEVWKILRTIPYGKTMTYGEIAKQIVEQKGILRMSAQAVGGAVGHNKISILVPCHRVIGTNGKLTGYAGGIEKKIKLLELEHVDIKASEKIKS